MSKHDDSALVVLDGTDVAQRYPRALGRQPIDTIGRVREEMARCYKAVAAGKITTKQGSSMIFMLSVIARTIEVEKVEPMLEAIERAKSAG
jgi:hypothetical protein